jgi:hypothetical protein
MPPVTLDVYVEMLDKAKLEASYPGHQRELVPDAERGLHTDHCPKDKLDGFVRPLLDISIERVKNGQDPLFGSHMWDGSTVPLDENLAIADELLEDLRVKLHVAGLVDAVHVAEGQRSEAAPLVPSPKGVANVSRGRSL